MSRKQEFRSTTGGWKSKGGSVGDQGISSNDPRGPAAVSDVTVFLIYCLKKDRFPLMTGSQMIRSRLGSLEFTDTVTGTSVSLTLLLDT